MINIDKEIKVLCIVYLAGALVLALDILFWI